jgi:thermolysin
MKRFKTLTSLALILIFTVYSFSFRPTTTRTGSEEKAAIELAKGKSVFTSNSEQLKTMNALLEREIVLGNLNLFLNQTEPDRDSIHQRYNQYYQGIPVWGAQLIRHSRAGKVYCINGRYYDDIDIEVAPELARESALEIARNDLSDSECQLLHEPELIIFPAENEYYLAYKLILKKYISEMIYFVNAWTGEIILKYDNTKTTAEIGAGTGVHNDTKKVSADYNEEVYSLIDRMRPAIIETYDMEYDYGAWDTYNYTDANLGEDDDNNWSDRTEDKALVDAHCYTGWTYDYYYLVHGRRGYDNDNLTVKAFVNILFPDVQAYYRGYDNSISFFDGNGVDTTYLAGALDVVAHEFSHGITDFTSDLIYSSESGALNEAFSDIMGACVEFYHQRKGKDHLKADWLLGEDIYIIYESNQALRRMDKPFLLSFSGGPYPDHYSKIYILPNTLEGDWGGVHINSSIANHWFYLLSEGGTNKTSGISVTGIGISKAEKIAYQAWIHYLIPSSDFADARLAGIQAAEDLYGAESPEVDSVQRAWDAVGVF